MATNPVSRTWDNFVQTSYGEWSLAHAKSQTSPSYCLQALARTDQKNAEIIVAIISSAQVHIAP